MPDLSLSRRTTALSAAVLAVLGSAAPAFATAGPALLHGSARAHHHFVDPHGRVLQSTSSNWAGYAVTGSTYSSVSASWTEPSVGCGAGSSYSSFWIGLDGDGSSTVEQTGSEADCSNGTPQYYAWYEMYPAYPVNFSSPVRPGDHLTSSVSSNGSGSFTLYLADTTRGWSHTVKKTLRSAKRASAEIIAEAPSSTGGVLPLADFGSVSFDGTSVNGSPLGGYSPDRITMATGSTTKATTSSLSGGQNFSVTWKHS